jgi:hypothetical protein
MSVVLAALAGAAAALAAWDLLGPSIVKTTGENATSAPQRKTSGVTLREDAVELRGIPLVHAEALGRALFHGAVSLTPPSAGPPRRWPRASSRPARA